MKVRKDVLIISAILCVFGIIIVTFTLLKHSNNKKENTSKKNIKINKANFSKNESLFSERPVVGLINHNFVCYFNSIIQALYSQTNFIQKLFEYKHDQSQKCIIILKELFQQILNGKIVDTCKYLENILKVTKNRERIKTGIYQDVQKCLRVIFDQIKEEHNRKLSPNSQDIDFEKIRNDFFFFELFYFKQKTTYICSECQTNTSNYNVTNILYLYLEYSVQESINALFTPSYLDCQGFKLYKTIHDQKKFIEIIFFPLSIIIRNNSFPLVYLKILINNKIIIQNRNYEFKACIFHVKDVHYYTVAKLNNRLYKLNDTLVTELDIESIENLIYSDIPLLLFYKSLY